MKAIGLQKKQRPEHQYVVRSASGTPADPLRHRQTFAENLQKNHLLHLILNTQGKPDFDGLPPID